MCSRQLFSLPLGQRGEKFICRLGNEREKANKAAFCAVHATNNVRREFRVDRNVSLPLRRSAAPVIKIIYRFAFHLIVSGFACVG